MTPIVWWGHNILNFSECRVDNNIRLYVQTLRDNRKFVVIGDSN